MFNNPFTPIFGGKPDVFFGRKSILKRFDIAMTDRGSNDRALFFTGTRGSGKTALLEQLSIRAAKARRTVIDLGPEDTVVQLVQELAGFDEKTIVASPQASINVFGIGGSASAGSISKAAHMGRERLQAELLKACDKAKHGVLVTVDEVQKVPIDDISSLCNAFQMASRKGHDVMLAVAGLPYAHAAIIEHEGCTYLRRASHVELGLFTWEEAAEAFSEAFSRIKGLRVCQEVSDKLNQASFGQPYLMQLIGYHLVNQINESTPGSSHDVTEREAASAVETAVLVYKQRALKPLLNELPRSECDYLRAASECLDDRRLASTAAIADKLKTPQRNLSRARARLIDNGVIAAPERGKVMFCIPYLADFVQEDKMLSSAVEIARRRRV